MKSFRYIALHLILLLECPLAVPATEIIISSDGHSQTLEVKSLRIARQFYLNWDTLSTLLPITAYLDSAGVFVLCTKYDCVPVFAMDSAEVAFQDGKAYVHTDAVARALGCKSKIKRDRVEFSCETLDTTRVGMQVGDAAPGFRLLDGDSTLQTLAELHQHGSLLLAFIRSAQWDPFTRDLLREIETSSSKLRGGGFGIAAIHGYNLKLARAAVDSLHLSFPVLTDPFGAVMRGYEVFDKGNLPFPAVLVIDRNGIIRYRKVWEDVSQPPDWKSVMDELGKVER